MEDQMKNALYLEVEFNPANESVELSISAENTTGCSYAAKTKEDIVNCMADYLDTYVL